MNVYDFTVKAQDKSEVALSKYRGETLLIVNTATGCAFTPQYDDLEALYKKFHERGFNILDFPCNQFGQQAPGTDSEINAFCSGCYGITFPQFSKIDVNGDSAAPLFKWLTQNTVFSGFDMLHPVAKKLIERIMGTDPDYAKTNSIKWNFTKFLIDKNGEIVARFEPTTSVRRIRNKLESIL